MPRTAGTARSILRAGVLLTLLLAINFATFFYVTDLTFDRSAVVALRQKEAAILRGLHSVNGVGEPLADIRTWLLSLQPTLFADAQAVLAKHSVARTGPDATTLIRYFFFLGNDAAIETQVVHPFLSERDRLALPAIERRLAKYRSNEPQSTNPNAPAVVASPEDETALYSQRDVADAIMKSLRYTLLLAAYLNERSGRGRVAARYYNQYLAILQPIVNRFDYTRSRFIQQTITLARIKSVQLKYAITPLRMHYHIISYFNYVLEGKLTEALKAPPFGIYSQKGIVGTAWSGTTHGREYLNRLIQLRDKYAPAEDPFLHLEVCAALWVPERDELREKECPAWRILRLAEEVRQHRLVYSLLKYLPIRYEESKTERAEALIQFIADPNVTAHMKDDAAANLHSMLYEKYYKETPAIITKVFPFGRFDAAPGVLEID